MELRHLRYFIAVAEEGHVTRAAERLGMQQPPLSQQIKALEQELKVQLFRRKPRGVELTAAGTALLADARAILEHVDHAFAATQRTARGEEGRITIGFTSSAPFHPLIPRAIRAFREAYPRVTLTMVEGGTGELTDQLRAERLDAAFVRRAAPDPSGIVVDELVEEAMIAALPTGHALAPRTREDDGIPLKALADETFVVYRRLAAPGLYDAIIAACHAAGFSPRVGQEAPRIVTTLNFVAAGLGVSIVPASLQRMQLDGVVYRKLKGPHQPKAPLNVAWRRSETAPAVRRLRAIIKQAAARER